MLALHAGPIEFAALPFANVAELLEQIPLPVPALLGHADADRDRGARGPGRRDAAGASGSGAARRACGPLPGGRFAHRAAAAPGRRAGVGSVPSVRIAFDVEKLTWELDFFVRHFLEGYRGCALTPPSATRSCRGVESIAEELAVGAARAVSSRLSQPQPHAARRRACHIIDFQDARMGPDTYDLASLLRDSYVDLTGPGAGRAHRLFPRAERTGPATRRQRVPRAVRPDGASSAISRRSGRSATRRWHAETRCTSSTCRARLRYVRTNLAKYPRFARLRDAAGRPHRGTAILEATLVAVRARILDVLHVSRRGEVDRTWSNDSSGCRHTSITASG